MKRLLAAFALSLVFALGLAPGLALAASGDTQASAEYDLWVADVQVTSANASNITGKGISGKISYSAATHTLTLENATISADHSATVYYYRGSDPVPYAYYHYYGIFQKESPNLTIKLVGTNTIKSPYNGTDIAYYGIGFGSAGNLNITGNGSLSISASHTDYVYGIKCDNLTVNSGATVTVKMSASDEACCAVDADGAITVKGTLKASASGKDYAFGVRASKCLTVAKGGKLYASATDKDTSMYTGATAVRIYSGGALSVNGLMKATSTWDGIEAESGVTMKVGATGEVIAVGEHNSAIEEASVSLGSSKLDVLAGDNSKNAQAVAASAIGTAKYIHIFAKKANPMTAKAKTVTFSVKKVAAKSLSVSAKKAFTVKKAKGKVTYKVAKYLTKTAKGAVKVAKNGKVTVKKGTVKGSYKLKVKITAAGSSAYKSKSKTVKLVVKVK